MRAATLLDNSLLHSVRVIANIKFLKTFIRALIKEQQWQRGSETFGTCMCLNLYKNE
jgi:hypothetical protein